MGTSTVSGPFRSQNGFQELVNGVWTPVGGGGGGNPNDIVITTTLNSNADWLTPTSSIFTVDLGVPMQTIKDSVESGGKWACFSGFDMVANVRSALSTSGSYTYWLTETTTNVQIVNAVCPYSVCYNELVFFSSDCGSVTAYPTSGTSNSYCFGNTCAGAPGMPTFTSCGYIATGYYGYVSGLDLACPAKIFLQMSGVGTCGNPWPVVQVVTTLHFNNWTGQ
jgi:hypothetical protein